jgi:nicotinamide-nucleotide amidase
MARNKRRGGMRIEIICTGDEVLTGKIVNTNFAWISQKLEDFGFSVRWGTTVGDDRETLLAAFLQAGERADAVIVNGGLGPTVDDLSQEIAAKAAGVDLLLSEPWLARMEEFFRRRSRIMPPNNRKQAMLPQGAELIDNPVGTACGFAVTIGKARFFFTPGVPREMRRMVEDEIVPRLLKQSGNQAVIRLKRFHSYGIGESRADQLLSGIESIVPDGSVKLGFRAHYPQLETKLTVRGSDAADVERKLAPVRAEVLSRLGNFVLAEDDATLEGVILAALERAGASLAVAETFTGGQVAARISPLPGAERVFRRGIVLRDKAALATLYPSAGFDPAQPFAADAAAAVAREARRAGEATHGLALLVDLDEVPDSIEFGAFLHVGIATAHETVSRRARIVGGRDWVRLGAVELGLDCLRRYLLGLPVSERIDFEKV